MITCEGSTYDIITLVTGLKKMLSLTSRLLYLHGINLQYPCRGGITFSYSVFTVRTVYFPSEKRVFFFIFSTVYFTLEERVYLQNRPFTFKRAFIPSEQRFLLSKRRVYRQNTNFTPSTYSQTYFPTNRTVTGIMVP